MVWYLFVDKWGIVSLVIIRRCSVYLDCNEVMIDVGWLVCVYDGYVDVDICWLGWYFWWK